MKLGAALDHVRLANTTALSKLENLAIKFDIEDEHHEDEHGIDDPHGFPVYSTDPFSPSAAPASKGGGSGGSTGGKGSAKNKAPIANSDDMVVAVSGLVTKNVLANDTDANGDILTITSIGTALHGTVTFTATGSVTYKPVIGYQGFDSFTYKISDGKGGTATGTVNVTVGSPNHNPDAVSDTAMVLKDQSVKINVLSNDTDVDGNTLSITNLGLAKNGTVTLNADGTVTYVPKTGYIGSDSFTYTISDGKGGADTATVTVGVNNPPAPYYIQALDSGVHFAAGTTQITFAFASTIPSYLVGNSYAQGWSAFNEAQKAVTREIFANMEKFLNIDFVEVSSGGSIVLQNVNLGQSGSSGWTWYPYTSAYDISSDVLINVGYSYLLNPVSGDMGYLTFLHEIGHALGLKHTFDGGVAMPGGEDSMMNTVMSYNWAPSVQPETMMMYDIAALQYFYGANTSYNTGDNVYAVDWGSRYTIWDAGGNDTLDGSMHTGAMTLNLKDGTFSQAGVTNGLSIAIGTTLENAFGGSGSDTLLGNAAGNTLRGNGGDDILKGFEGNDILIGGLGMDTLYGGIGNDILYFDGQDVLYGDEGIDTMMALLSTTIESSSALLKSLEKLNLADAYSQTFNVKMGDILTLSDNDDIYVLGDAKDTVNVTGGSKLGQVTLEGILFNHFSDGIADLFVASTINVNQVA